MTNGTRRHLITVAQVAAPEADEVAAPEADEVAAPKFAVDAKVEERQFPHTALHLQPDAKRPYVLDPGAPWLTRANKSQPEGERPLTRD